MEPKYQKLRFTHPHDDKECQDMLLGIIKAKNERRKLKPNTKRNYSFIHKLSRPIELLLRELFHSDKNRFLLYEVYYQQKYLKFLREIDIVKIENSDSITIGEVKLTCCKSRAINDGVRQLEKSSKILQTNFNKIKCRLFIIDLLDYTDEFIDDSFLNIFKTITKENGFEYELITIPAILLLKYVMAKNIDIYGYEELFSEAINEAVENFEKRQQFKMDKLNSKIEKAINVRLDNKDKQVSESNIKSLPGATLIDYSIAA
jgi:hypothetical protein